MPRVVWRHELFVVAVAAVATLWTIGCGNPGTPSVDELSLDNGDNGRVLSVKLGDEIDVTLQTIGPGEYEEIPNVSSPAVAFLRASLLSPPNPGGPRQFFQFKAVAAGSAVISIAHTGQNPRFGITVNVR